VKTICCIDLCAIDFVCARVIEILAERQLFALVGQTNDTKEDKRIEMYYYTPRNDCERLPGN
jgi:hypothetical protein